MSATKIKVFTAVFYVWNTFPLHIYQLLNIFYETYSKFKLFKKKYIQMSRLRRQTCGVMIEDPKWKHGLWCKWALFKVRRIQQERRMAYTETKGNLNRGNTGRLQETSQTDQRWERADCTTNTQAETWRNEEQVATAGTDWARWDKEVKQNTWDTDLHTKTGNSTHTDSETQALHRDLTTLEHTGRDE